MAFVLNSNTQIQTDTETKPVINAVNILKRDMKKTFNISDEPSGAIVLKTDRNAAEESWKMNIGDDIVITAGDDLGFVYALLHISEKYLGIKPFWFWLDRRFEKRDRVIIENGEEASKKPAVRFRGWFFNDEVLMMKWAVNGDKREPWRMAFEALLRCGGNMTIPGTDKNSRLNRSMASDMGLWITHHHAEPLGAEIFARAYPGAAPNFMEKPELFYKLWEDAVKEQKDCKVVWNLCFRGQGDKPFWSDDTTGQFDTDEKRGALISSVIKKQRGIVEKYVKNPVFCANLYGEVMELYEKGYIELDDDVIKVKADNGYGKMVTRRRDNHNPRASAMPVKDGGRQGIYYHVSFYDLQAANHITMLPNSVSFVSGELDEVLENGGNDFWVINCSNVRPHTYYLDAVRKKWMGLSLTDETHSAEYCEDYYGGKAEIAESLVKYPESTVKYGLHDDEHAGEQFYTESVRIIAHNFIIGNREHMNGFNWIADGGDFFEQTKSVCGICEKGLERLGNYYGFCAGVSEKLTGSVKRLYDETILLQSEIHYFCASGMSIFGRSMEEFEKGNYKEAFVLAGDSAQMYGRANDAMLLSENGIWEGFYFNDCFADIKHSEYMIRKTMGVIREFGDNSRHDKWYRDTLYAPEDREVTLLLVTDNHMTDDELYRAMKEGKMK